MKRIILSIVLMNFIGTTEAQNIIIAKQGHFSVGGVTIQREGEYDNRKFVGWVEQEETGQSYRADHAFVDFQIPADAHRLPLVYVHGYGGSGVCWQMTPDGRDGFATLMLRRGWSSYVMDLPVGGVREEHRRPLQSNPWQTRCSGSIYGASVFGRTTTKGCSSRKIPCRFRSSSAK